MTRFWVTRRDAAVLGLGGLAAMIARRTALAEPVGLATEWTGQKNGRVRLMASRLVSTNGAAAKLYASVHIQLTSGWKTYWRQPGEAGVPPSFDWAGSDNLAEARVLYPAPQRLADAGMTSLGYKSEIVFPVEITARAPDQPITLKLAIEYGVCKDICIPVEAKLSLVVSAGLATIADSNSTLLSAHLARVPGPVAPGSPSVTGFKAELTGATPRLTIDALFPKGSDGADVLIEVPGGELAPFAVITERKGKDAVRFEARFASIAEAQRFAGKPLLLTLLSANAQAEARAQMP
jgi:DsbC/DsbD-like thiol-disulfide interchange protein